MKKIPLAVSPNLFKSILIFRGCVNFCHSVQTDYMSRAFHIFLGINIKLVSAQVVLAQLYFSECQDLIKKSLGPFNAHIP